jgi:hypothetical protein
MWLGLVVFITFVVLLAVVWRIAAPSLRRAQDERYRPPDEYLKRPDDEGNLLWSIW